MKLGEKQMRKVVEELFDPAQYKIAYNVRKEAQLQKVLSSPTTQSSNTSQGSPTRVSYHELDIWIPELTLGFEYQVCLCSFAVLSLIQDKHHYVSTWYANDTLAKYRVSFAT